MCSLCYPEDFFSGLGPSRGASKNESGQFLVAVISEQVGSLVFG